MSFYRINDLLHVEMLPGIGRRAVWLEGVMLTFFTFEPNAIVPEHAHPHEQITLVTRGAMEFTLDRETRILRTGDGVCIPPNVTHKAVILDEKTDAVDAWNPPRDDYKT
ncbi:cupin domain-containing protein [Candidatus Bipolaricaulota bacterium]|nr:cupin domain-containing protein [Candidatus Bipolaricaulota bacterium]